MPIKLRLLAVLILLFGIAGGVRANTYYIDYSSGSNSNPGTKASPWKSHPYMICGSAPSYTHVAGDQFIFKGGVTWPVACVPMSIPLGGSSNTVRDVYTVDQTWFAGSSFTNPTISGSGAAISILVKIAASNVTMSYFNMGGQSWNGLSGAGDDGNLLATVYVPTGNNNVTVSHSELHDWTLSTANSNFSHEWVGMGYGKTAAAPNPTVVCDYCYVHDDANPSGYVGNCFYAITFSNGHCYALLEGAVGFADVHDDEINCIGYGETGCPASGWGLVSGSGQHLNVIEVGNQAYNGSIWNMLIHDTMAGVTLYLCPGMNVFNSVFWNDPAQGDPPIMYDGTPSCGFTAATIIANNTVDNAGGTAVRLGAHPGPMGAMNIQNNIWVNPGSGPIEIDAGTTFTSYTATPNHPMPSSEATMYGFVPANKYSPSSSDPNTVGQGTSLASFCSSLPALCFDASGAPWFGGVYKSRASSTDLGAFQFSGGSPGFISLSSSLVNFGSITIGQSSAVQFVTLTNTGGTTLTFNSDAISGDFSFGGLGNCNNPGGTLAPGANCNYSMKFNPTATGTRTGSVTINDTASNSPQTINLIGVGILTLLAPPPPTGLSSIAF